MMPHTPLSMFVSLLSKQLLLVWLAHKSPRLIILLSAGLQHYALSAFDASVREHTHSAAKLPYLPKSSYCPLSSNLNFNKAPCWRQAPFTNPVVCFNSTAPVMIWCMLHHLIYDYYRAMMVTAMLVMHMCVRSLFWEPHLTLHSCSVFIPENTVC